jgi:ribose/xylose/arabinose/galactoside ABC-type transport system permease subunit
MNQQSIPAYGTIKHRFSELEKRDVIFIALVLTMLVIFMSKSLESSLLGNLQLLATSMATIGIVAAGQTLVIITGGIDLSVGSVVGLTGMITAYLATVGLGPLGTFNPWAAALVALLAATGVGWINGTLVGRYKLAPFIVTFGMLNLLHGATQLLSNGTPINLGSDAFDWMWAKVLGIIPVPAILLLVVFVITAYLLRNSRYGRYAYAIGSNETVAHLSGVNVERTRQIIYAASGFLAGLSGLLLLSLIKGGALQNGQYYELISIAAVIIGGTSLRGGTGGAWGTLVGVLLMAIVKNGIILFSVPPLWNELITGAVIIAAALIDIQRRRLIVSIPALHNTITAHKPQNLFHLKTLDQALNQFTQALDDRFEYSALSIFLLNRETNQLVRPGAEPCPPGTLAEYAFTSGKTVIISDLRRDRTYQPADLKPDSRVAAAVPIIRDGQRIVGVVEFQSTAAGTFTPSEMESVMNLCSQLAAPVEDNWLLEIGWLTRQIRDNLRNLPDDAYLDTSELGEWLLMGIINRGESLRQILLDAIDYLHSERLDANSRALRRYMILRQTYIEQKPVEAIIRELGLSRRQYFYDLKEGIDAITDYIFRQHQSRYQAQ